MMFEQIDKSKCLSYALKTIQGINVLLVEDNEINQELAVDILSSNGIRVSIANNGKEAIQLIENNYFDCVLMDCQMPVMDGYEATKLIRQRKEFQTLPILAMTANPLLPEGDKTIAAGMNDHISKPIDINELFLTIAKWTLPDTLHHKQITDISASESNIYRSELAERLPARDTGFNIKMKKMNELLFNNDTGAEEFVFELRSLAELNEHQTVLDNLSKALESYDFSLASQIWSPVFNKIENS